MLQAGFLDPFPRGDTHYYQVNGACAPDVGFKINNFSTLMG